jgi:hypothetical protein
MTRAIGCVLLLLVSAGSAQAQNLRFGARAGVNVATITVDPDDGGVAFDARTGLVAGVFATWRALSWLEVQPEVLYASKGAALEQEGIDVQLVLDYVEVPLLARISKRMPRVTVYAAAGPALAWRVAAKSRTVFSGATEEIDLADDVEPFDLGIAAGGGVEAGMFVIDVRYTFGLRDIDADKSDAVTIKTRVLSLSAGIRF